MDLKVNVAFYSTVFDHKNGEELCSKMVSGVNNALRAYRDEHNDLPTRIIFYRDGVGDGQIEHVHQVEVTKIKAKIDEIYKNASKPDVKFAFILVNKRINTRIFNNGNNPGSGTVVDDVITLPERLVNLNINFIYF